MDPEAAVLRRSIGHEYHDEEFHDADSTPPMDVEHSLPTTDEVKNTVYMHQPNVDKVRRRFLVLLGFSTVALALIIGFSVGIARKSKRASLASTADGSALDAKPDVGDRFSQVQDFLSFYSTRSSLETASTPQYLAAMWIANKDGRQVEIPSSTDYSEAYPFVQRYVLALMYFALGGENWVFKQVNWLHSKSECDWNFGMRADQMPPGATTDEWFMGVQCTYDGEVDYIFLPHNNLVGQLPDEIGLLEGIEHFSAFANKLSGPLPQTIGNWKDLIFLAAESNELTGQLGNWFNFPKLEYLALGDNQFSGPLPSFSFGKKLKEVALDSNQFTGPIDVFNEASNLKSLFLQNNALVGPIGSGVLENVKLIHFDISNNFITGNFIEHYYTFQIVDMHNNSISGELPDVEYAGYPLTFLSVYDNNIGGPMPDTIGFLTNLVHLDLSYNSLTGPIVDDLNNLASLEYLFLHRNADFSSGRIPNLYNLENLKELSLKGTNRVGTIPAWIGSDLVNLTLLDFHDNALQGPLPTSMGSLVNLRFFFANNNKINGTIPDEFSALENLSIVTLDQNDLTGDDGAICGNNKPENFNYFVGDCDEFTCDCCTKCCSDNNPNCNNLEMAINFDSGYERDQYVFSEDLLFDIATDDATTAGP